MKILANISQIEQCLKSYGDIKYMFHFVMLNNFNSLQAAIPANTDIIVDNFVINDPIPTFVPVIVNPNLNIKTVYNQSMFDIACRYYGDISYAIKLMLDNKLKNIGCIIHGLDLNVNSVGLLNQNVVYFNQVKSVLTTEPPGKSFNISWNISWD